MRARIQRWGDSLAVRIPEPLALETALDQDSEVEVLVEGGRLVIAPVDEPRYTLEELVAGITDENRHAEIDSGPSVGNEAW